MTHKTTMLIGVLISGMVFGIPLAYSADPGDGTLAEIIVTATRRAENLSKIPSSVTAFSAEQLQNQGIQQIDDLSRLAPGVSFTRNGDGTNTISIRGIVDNGSSGGVGAGTTGIYIDDTPIQPRSAGLSFTSTNVYPHLFDMQRVEVLRGPQGTLFGSGSLGGALRFITPEPSLDKSEFRVHAEGSSIRYGDPSYQIGVVGGGAISEGKLGIRVSVFDRRDGGWIDRIQRYQAVLQEKDANYTETRGGRIALTWAPTDQLKISPSFFVQDVYSNDKGLYWEGFSNPGSGQFANAAAPQPTSDRMNLAAVKVEYDLGSATLVSNTSYYYRRNRNQYDITAAMLQLTLAGPQPLTLDYQVPGLPNFAPNAYDLNQQNSFTQEFRIASKDADARLTWQAGLFYQRMRAISQDFVLSDPATFDRMAQGIAGVDYLTLFFGIAIRPPNITYQTYDNNLEKQTALFGELSYKLTERLKATIGARASQLKVDSTELVGGPYSYISTELTGSTNSQKENPVTPKFSLAFQADENNLLYATASKGFRGGGTNQQLGSACAPALASLGFSTPPETFNSDSLWSYEIGSKNLLFDKRLSISASAYRIKWKGIQQALYLVSCNQSLTYNAGEVTSKGFDVQAVAQVTPTVRLNASLAYTKATFDQALLGEPDLFTGIQPVRINKGDSIGTLAWNSPAPWTASAGVEFDFNAGGHDGFARADYTYSSKHNVPTAAEDPVTVLFDADQEPIPKQQLVNLRGGMTFGALETTLFVENVFNQIPKTRWTYFNLGTQWFMGSTPRPRAIGIAAVYRIR